MKQSDRLLQHFLAHRHVTHALIEKIQESDYDYKPTPTSMSVYKLVTHMLTSFYRFALTVKTGDISPFEQQLDVENKNLIELSTHYTEKIKEIISSITNKELNHVVDATAVFGKKIPAAQLLQMALDHEIHHKGNLFVYVRELGHTELPFYIDRS
ncbi:hypothetical protein FZC66_07330 [Priestia megaterium]|nr:hypothetical protein FZC66_07330 [Priestia megaterium]